MLIWKGFLTTFTYSLDVKMQIFDYFITYLIVLVNWVTINWKGFFFPPENLNLTPLAAI